jgi:hypothetical protein
MPSGRIHRCGEGVLGRNLAGEGAAELHADGVIDLAPLGNLGPHHRDFEAGGDRGEPGLSRGVRLPCGIAAQLAPVRNDPFGLHLAAS